MTLKKPPQTSFRQTPSDYEYLRVVYRHLQGRTTATNFNEFVNELVMTGIAHAENTYNNGAMFDAESAPQSNRPLSFGYTERVTCPQCQGRQLVEGAACPACQGFGTLMRENLIPEIIERLEALERAQATPLPDSKTR